MYVHEEKKVGFIAHPRTASTATGHVLTELGFIQRINHHGFKPEWDLTGWNVFSTVRDPFDLMVSWYHHKKRYRAISFQEWLPLFLKESNQYLDQGLFFGVDYSQHWLHYETLQADFDETMRLLGFPQREIPWKNVSVDRPDKPLSEYYNDSKLINLMTSYFGKEINTHGYQTPCQDS